MKTLIIQLLLVNDYILRIFEIRVCGFSINVKVKFYSNIQGILNIKVMLAALAIIHISMDKKFIMTIFNFKWTLYMSSKSSEQMRFIFKKHRFHLHYASWKPTQSVEICQGEHTTHNLLFRQENFRNSHIFSHKFVL